MTTPAAAPPPSEAVTINAVTINAVAGIARTAADMIRASQLADQRETLMRTRERIAQMAREEAANGVEASGSYARVLLLQNNANIRAHNEQVRLENERRLQALNADLPVVPPHDPSLGASKNHTGLYIGLAAVAVITGGALWYKFGRRA